jgi:hypothetical protein
MEKLFLVILIFSSGFANAQTIKLVDGDPENLKGVKSLSTEFIYHPMRVGKFDNEKDYVEDKRAKLNADEKGRGDTWATRWLEDRERRFEPKFRELFAKHSGISFKDKDVHKLVFKTTSTEPGWSVLGGLSFVRSSARIDAEVSILDSRNKVLVKYLLTEVPGGSVTNDWDTGARIQEAYAKAGKDLGKLLKSKIR